MRQNGILRIRVTPSTGHAFSEWQYTISGQQYTNSTMPLALCVSEDIAVLAVMEISKITLNLKQTGEGAISGGGIYEYGSTAKISA